MTALTLEDGPSKKSDAAYERLKMLVMSGKARPGRHLNAQEVALQLGISVTPLRDAMVRLATEGFLSRESNYGFSTKELRIEEERQILLVCNILLSAGLRSAGNRMSDKVRKSLEELQDVGGRTLEEAIDMADRIRDMYLDVARAADNDVLFSYSSVVVDRSHLVRTLDIHMEGPDGKTVEYLREIAIGMSSDDPERAVAATKAILYSRIDRLPILVKEANFIASQARFP